MLIFWQIFDVTCTSDFFPWFLRNYCRAHRVDDDIIEFSLCVLNHASTTVRKRFSLTAIQFLMCIATMNRIAAAASEPSRAIRIINDEKYLSNCVISNRRNVNRIIMIIFMNSQRLLINLFSKTIKDTNMKKYIRL